MAGNSLLNNPECPNDKQPLRKQRLAYLYKGNMLGHFNAWYCHKCNYITFTEESKKKIIDRAKAVGIFDNKLEIP